LPNRYRVLVVDDNQINRKLTVLQLRKIGFEADSAADGPSAYKFVCDQGAEYKLVLMDCHMPGTNGFVATETILKHRPDLTVVGITASLDPQDGELARESGMTALISRPIGLQGLRSALMTALDAPKTA
jgi:CheY-like chemotaxis protein